MLAHPIVHNSNFNHADSDFGLEFERSGSVDAAESESVVSLDSRASSVPPDDLQVPLQLPHLPLPLPLPLQQQHSLTKRKQSVAQERPAKRRLSDSSIDSNTLPKNFKLGTRLLAHSHAQLTKLLLQIAEKRMGDAGQGNYTEIENEIKDSVAVLTKLLPPIRQNQNSNSMNASTNNSSSRDSSWFRKSAGAISQIKAVVLKHAQNIVDGAMYRDYITFFAPLALTTAETLPRWDDPKKINFSKRFTQALSKCVVSDTPTGSMMVSKLELDALVRLVKECKGFNEELGEFRG
ncbi:hypothetical protein BCR33DRAFT_714028, partial [Rhizoclosmatium globosum]